jgi:phosphonate transport system substrate-binding protein
MTRFSRHITILFVAALFATTECRAAQTETKNAKTLLLGVIFQGTSQPVEAHFRPLMEYVARKFSPAGETKGVIIVASSPGQMIKLLEEKRVDFYMESPYPTYLINRLGAAKLLLRAWKGGMAEYRSLIFATKQSGVTEPKELRGRIIAFEDPGSTSGYFLPKLYLLKKGFPYRNKQVSKVRFQPARSTMFSQTRPTMLLTWSCNGKYRPELSVQMITPDWKAATRH